MDSSYWAELLRPVYAGRRWLVVADRVAAGLSTVDRLARYGAAPSFLIAGEDGSDHHHVDPALKALVPAAGGSIMEGYRAFASAIADLPAGVLAQMDRWDPDHAARVIGGYLYPGTPLAGRMPFGARPREWEALENKVTIDALWDAVGIARAPSVVVPAERDRLRSAAESLDTGLGTVWTADNKRGWHGAAEFSRWVTTRETAADAAEIMEGHADEVRIAPFLDGRPCSIHGVVFPEKVLTLRPVEILVLRRPGQSTFQYAGVATHWLPTADDIAYLRSVAATVGAHLREHLGYRGAFGIDGVLTAEGWLPTELNPRGSVGFGTLVGALEGFDFGSLNRALWEGLELDYRPQDLEDVLRQATASTGRGGGYMALTSRRTETEALDIVFERDKARLAAAGESRHGEVSIGPGALGGHVRVVLDPHRIRFGDAVAPLTAAAIMLADRIWDLGVGPLEAAPDLR